MKKSAKEMIEHINQYLFTNKVNDEQNDLLLWACFYLINIGQYEGYNFYKTVDGRRVMCDVEDCEFIQLLTKL